MKCDSKEDCLDGSDEMHSCQEYETCRPGQFKCLLTHKCLPSGWVCDGEEDCGTSSEYGPDMSDEDPKHCQKFISCPWNEGHCGNSLDCIHLSKFCDGHGDCPDNSDELNFCNNNTSCVNHQCEYKCKQTQSGSQCFCKDGWKPDGAKCVDADECEIDYTCQQLCSNTIGSFKCFCVEGYIEDGPNCKAINSGYILIAH